MKGTNIGEFEELVLLTVAALMHDAYSVAICDELSKHNGPLNETWRGACGTQPPRREGTCEKSAGRSNEARGGKRKRFYQLTIPGKAALVRARRNARCCRTGYRRFP